MKRLFMLFGLLWLALSAAPASAQADGQWQGTWKTTYGELRLHERRGHVWGDYGDVGEIQGRLSNDRQSFRGIFRRKDGRDGYLELVQSGDDGNRFVGRWRWKSQGFPDWRTKSGDFWRGDRTSSAAPRLKSFSSPPPIGRLFSQLDTAGLQWTAFRGAAASAQETGNPAPPKAHPWAKKMPIFKGAPADFMPKSFTVHVQSLLVMTGLQDGATAEFYGNVGVYAYCHTASGSRELKPYGAQKNRIFERTRDDYEVFVHKLGKNEGGRTFPMDRACLSDPSGRIVVQIQTNLVERDIFKRGDDKFGYKAGAVYLDQIPVPSTSKEYHKVGKFRVRSLPPQSEESYFAYEEDGGEKVDGEFAVSGSLTFNP